MLGTINLLHHLWVLSLYISEENLILSLSQPDIITKCILNTYRFCMHVCMHAWVVPGVHQRFIYLFFFR